MSKVKEIIELWDTDRQGNDAVFYYVTPEMDETQDALKFLVLADELRDLIEENELNEFQTDVDQFRQYDSQDYLIDNWEDVANRFWLDIVQPRLESNYKEAMAYMESFISKCPQPLSEQDSDRLRKQMVAQYGFTFGRRAA